MTICTTPIIVQTNTSPSSNPMAIKWEILPCLKSRSRLALLCTPINAERVLDSSCQKLIWSFSSLFSAKFFTLGIALYVVSHKSNRRQVITFTNSKVRIEKGVYHCDASWEFNAGWVRLHYQITGETDGARKLELGCHGNCVEVGEFLHYIEKDALAFQLKDCIIRGWFSVPPG